MDAAGQPWDENYPPALHFEGLAPKSLFIDVLRAFHLGVLRTFVASMLIGLCHREAWAGGDLQGKLASAFWDFKLWLKAKRKTVAVAGFQSCVAKTWEYPEISCKGADTGLVLGWLASICEAGLLQLSEWHMSAGTAAISADRCVREMAAHGIFLPSSACERVSYLLRAFVQCHAWLRQQAHMQGLLLFPQKPKFHLIMHVELDARDAAARGIVLLNPWTVATWMNEDAIGRLSRIARRTHPRTAAAESLRRHLLFLRSVWSRARRSAG